ncbi:UNVERIFIED_CONTAM: hypothetical protein FKN15_043262, partial [Acipenser sinensis]
ICHVLYGERVGLLSDSPNPEAQRFISAVEIMLETTLPLLYLPPRLLQRLGAPLWKEHVTAWDHIFQHVQDSVRRQVQRALEQAGGDVAQALRAAPLLRGTTAVPLQFCLFELARTPSVQDSVRRQVQRALEQAGGDVAQALRAAPLLRGTVKEILRLYPVGISVQRYPVKDIVLQNYHIPAGLQCVLRAPEVLARALAGLRFWLRFWLRVPVPGVRVWVQAVCGAQDCRDGDAAVPDAPRIRRYSESMAGLSQSQDSFIQRQQLDAAMADTFLEHLCLLDIDQEPITARNTSIVCTIGPASRSVEKLQEMIKAGMNVARLNFSHGSHEYHAGSIESVRRAVESLSAEPLCYRPVAIALDTKGPEIRTGLVRGEEGGEVELVRGSRVRVVTQDSLRDSTDASQIWLDYKNVTRVVRVGGRVYVDDGLISLRVLQIGTVQYNTIQYNTIQYNTIQYNTIQYNTIQYNTIQYNTIQYNTIQYNTIQYNTIQYNTIQYNTIQYNTIQYNTIQYNTIQYNTIQYNTIQYNTIQYNTIQYNTIQYNTIQYNTIQYNTIQYNTIQYNTIQYNTIQYNTIQYNTIQYNTIQYNTIQYNTIQYNTIQYNTIQYNTIQCNTIQYNTIQYNTIQYNSIQYNTIQYNAIQYNTIQYNTIQCNTIQYNLIQYNTIQYNTV